MSHSINNWIITLGGVCALAVAAGAWCQVTGLADTGWPPTHPVLERFNQAITFYASFDGRAAADLSVGRNTPIGNAQQLEWGEGMMGQALRGRSRNLIYEAEANIDLSRSGALVMWVCPLGWAGDEEIQQIPWLHVDDHGRSLYLARQGGKANHQALMAIYGEKISDASTRSLVKNGSSRHWQKGQWHMLAVNWQEGAVELSVDGGLFKYDAASKPGAEPTDEPGKMNVAAGGTAPTPYLMDELLILDRPLDNEEVKWLYQAVRKDAAATAALLAPIED